MIETYVDKLKRITKQAQEYNRNIQTATVELEGCFNRLAELQGKIREITERMVEQ